MAENEGRVVEECPPPPPYYKLFTEEAAIEPPNIPSIEDIRIHSQFNFLSPKNQYDSTLDIQEFQAECRRHLSDILALSLELSSSFASNTNQTAMRLNEKIGNVYELLKGYRDHEAREVLCEELRKQVSNAKAIENNLRVCLEKNRHLLETSMIS